MAEDVRAPKLPEGYLGLAKEFAISDCHISFLQPSCSKTALCLPQLDSYIALLANEFMKTMINTLLQGELIGDEEVVHPHLVHMYDALIILASDIERDDND